MWPWWKTEVVSLCVCFIAVPSLKERTGFILWLVLQLNIWEAQQHSAAAQERWDNPASSQALHFDPCKVIKSVFVFSYNYLHQPDWDWCHALWTSSSGVCIVYECVYIWLMLEIHVNEWLVKGVKGGSGVSKKISSTNKHIHTFAHHPVCPSRFGYWIIGVTVLFQPVWM